jgi:H+/Cl- antiporter ClcA
MYLAFYFWHGIFLDEINRISYSKTLFFLFAAITYLVISFVIFKVYELKLLKKYVKNLFLRGLISGIVVGIIVFVISRVADVGLGKSITLEHLLFDATWQSVEQAIGGCVMALGQAFIYDPVLEQETIKAKD